ncbi:MAG: SBBP repeat-containing protein [Planctomycetota bacterium]
MRNSTFRWSLMLTAVLTAPIAAGGAAAGAPPAARATRRAGLKSSFIENHGQWQAPVRYATSLAGMTVGLERDAMLVRLRAQPAEPGSVVRLAFEGASASAALTGDQRAPGVHHFLTGNDRSAWRQNVPAFTRVCYEALYPGVDVAIYLKDGQLEYDVLLAPGADLAQLVVCVDGCAELKLQDRALVIATPSGELRQTLPETVEITVDGGRCAVPCRFRLLDAHRFGFDVTRTDPSARLCIDPTLTYSTYLGGSGLDDARDVAVDSTGAAYVTGITESMDFPATGGAFDNGANGAADVFIAKLSAAGSTLVYATYLGGSGVDWGFGIAVDGSGAAYVTGQTSSANFPSSLYGYGGSGDAFVAKLNGAGSDLVYATYLGGSSLDTGYGIAIDASGAAYVAGQTDSSNFPTTSGAFDRTRNASQDGFVAKIAPNGSALTYSTYLGGTLVDSCEAIAVDASGAAYVTGQTASTDFPIQGGFDGIPFGTESFVTKLNSAGSALVYSTYLGGGGIDVGYGIVVNAAGEAYVTGSTSSSDFPITPGAYDTSLNGGSDVFVTRLNLAGNVVVGSTFIGGSGDDVGQDIVLSASGSISVAGWTSPAGFPTTPDALDSSYDGSIECFVTKLNAAGTALTYSTFLGGNGTDLGFGLAIDREGALVVVGQTSGGFPTTAGAYDRFANGSLDAFVAKLEFNCEDGPMLLYTFTGDVTLGNFGYSVANAGDVNADGFDDIVVGGGGNTGLGLVRVFSGLTGAIVYEFRDLGTSVGAAGDVDADGFDDIVIGYIAANDPGSARVLSGRTGATLRVFSGASASDYFGVSVGCAHDVNRDGYDDVIVGAPFDDTSAIDAGAARVYSGSNGALLSTFLGDAASDAFGWSAAGCGDVNSDGYPDLIVGAIYGGGTDTGTARVFSGRNGTHLYPFAGDAAYEAFGFAVAGAGDVNADGSMDLVVGAPLAAPSGKARVFSGRTGATLSTSFGPNGNSWFGYAVSGAGDLDHDGFDDIIVGAPYENVPTGIGDVHVYSVAMARR